MLIQGSCHCGSIKFKLESPHPYPYNLCYCSICRKTAGGGGYTINLSGQSATLSVQGEEYKSVYQAIIDGEKSPAERHFCKLCATALWVYDSRWPELIHPFASAIDSELPKPPEKTHLMLDNKPDWVDLPFKEGDKTFPQYPDESIAQWHQRLGFS